MASQKDLDSQPVFEVGYAHAGNPIAHPLIGDAQSPGEFFLASVFSVTPSRQTDHQLLDLRRVHNYTKTYTDYYGAMSEEPTLSIFTSLCSAQ
jgi:hypothetical protein